MERTYIGRVKFSEQPDHELMVTDYWLVDEDGNEGRVRAYEEDPGTHVYEVEDFANAELPGHGWVYNDYEAVR